MKQADIVRGQRIAVVGAARSGLGVASLLKANGADVFVSDHQAPQKLAASINAASSVGDRQ